MEDMFITVIYLPYLGKIKLLLFSWKKRFKGFNLGSYLNLFILLSFIRHGNID